MKKIYKILVIFLIPVLLGHGKGTRAVNEGGDGETDECNVSSPENRRCIEAIIKLCTSHSDPTAWKQVLRRCSKDCRTMICETELPKQESSINTCCGWYRSKCSIRNIMFPTSPSCSTQHNGGQSKKGKDSPRGPVFEPENIELAPDRRHKARNITMGICWSPAYQFTCPNQCQLCRSMKNQFKNHLHEVRVKIQDKLIQRMLI